MRVSGPVVKQFNGGISSGASTAFTMMALFGILGGTAILAVLEDILDMVSYDDEEMVEIFLWILIALFLFLGVIGLMMKIKFSNGKVNQSYLEIRTDGVVIQPVIGDRNSEEFNAKFEEISRLSINKNGYFTQLTVEDRYGQKGILYVPDSGRGKIICDQVRQEAQKCGVAL